MSVAIACSNCTARFVVTAHLQAAMAKSEPSQYGYEPQRYTSVVTKEREIDFSYEWDVDAFERKSKRALDDCVIFLLPFAHRSSLRREQLERAINLKGGVVTTDPSAATHCVVAIPFGHPTATRLMNKYRVPASCLMVRESFVCPTGDHRPAADMVPASEPLQHGRKRRKLK